MWVKLRPRVGGSSDWKLRRFKPSAPGHCFHRHGVGGERPLVLSSSRQSWIHRRGVGGA